MRVPCYFAAALWLLHCCQSGSLAQPSVAAGATADAPRETPIEERTTGVQQVKPDTFVLPDEEGNLQPMLGWTFEDFLRAWKTAQEGRQTAEEPAFSLEQIECHTQAEADGFIRMLVQVQIRILDDGRVRVPVGFPNGILDAYEVSPQAAGSYVRFDEDLGEHVLWIEGEAGIPCQVELQILLPLTHRGKQTLLKFHPPRAAMSRLTLLVSGEDVLAESLTPSSRVSTVTETGHTQIVVRGLAETTEIAWRTLDGIGQEDSRALMAQSDLQVRAEPGLLRTEVALSVQDLRGEIHRFRFRLPAGHNLVSQELDQGTLHRIEDGETMRSSPVDGNAANRPAVGPIYEVRLTEPQSLPSVVRLVLDQPRTLTEEGTELMLSGVEVLDAVRQQGTVALFVSEDLRVRWEEGRRIRQITTGREAVGTAGLTATFEFDAADWQLPIVLASRRTEVSVSPDYQLEIGRDELRLTATFGYAVRGTMVGALRYALSDWELAADPMGPGSTIRGSSTFIDNAGTMYLSLANPAEGSFETTLRLKMPRPASSTLMQVRLPECLIRGQVLEGSLSVRADPSLEVIPQLQSSRGLSLAPRRSSATAAREPFEDAVQEFHVASAPAEYVALVRSRTRTIVNETRVAAELFSDQLLVEQEIHLDVRHLAANDLVLRAPASMAANPSVAYSLDGQSVAPPWEDFYPESGTGDKRIARFVLEQPQLGPAVLRIRYQIPLDREWGGTSHAPQEVILPIAVPEADSHRIDVTLSNHTSDLQAEFHKRNRLGAESPTEGVPPNVSTDGLHVEFFAPEFEVPLSIQPAGTMFQRTLIVERMWIQSRVAGDRMQTRTAMQLVPPAEQLVLDLGGASPAETRSVEINGHPVHVPADAAEVVISTSDLQEGAPCVIEVVQQTPFAPEVEGNLRVVPPRVVEARGYTNVFWQLVLPQSLHGFCTSPDLLSESPWIFQGAYWARVPTMAQGDLEAFVGVPHTAGPPVSSNELLMVGFDLPQVLEAKLVRRSSIVLLTSGGVLALGIVMLYVGRLQRWELMVAVGAALAVTGMLYPNLSPFIAQAGTLGMALVLVAILLKKVTRRRQSTISGRNSGDASLLPYEMAGTESTPIHVSSPETPSSARTLVHSLAESSVHHPA